MNIYDFLTQNSDLVKTMLVNGIDPSELQNVKLVEEYHAMKEKGHKTLYVVAFLADKYHVSERKVYRIVKRMGKEM